ncbi:MAG: STAS/SEC14 domain-containing protein [Roseiflexaceae bacterium]|nr:STAS/SEC14 domain-containing protein [Roseiflexaceae bacterium]
MTTIPIEISTEQLLQAVERLPITELDALAAKIAALRTRQQAARLNQDETTLLLAINQGHLPPEQQLHFDALVAKRQAGTISPDDLQELIQRTEASEQHVAVRLAAIHELAQLRGTTVAVMMQALGIRARVYD